jgi:signal transduction histidine kinase
VADLGLDVDRMAERLGVLERARAEFIAKVSHDLRTPLTVIRGYAYTLERRARGEDRRRLASIGRETDRLAALVDDLLTLSQAGAGALQVSQERIEPEELLEEVEERVRPAAVERGVALEIESAAELELHGDRRRLAQVLTNLATNAIRHTPAGGEVVLCALPGADGGVELVVADDGEGIDPELVPTLLLPFERGNGPSGTGLGLAIAVELVQAHGGRLQLLPRDGGGTVASAWLPPAPRYAERTP